MTARRKITLEPASKRTGLTVDELRTFLGELDAAGVSGDEPVRVVSGVRGNVKQVSVEAHE